MTIGIHRLRRLAGLVVVLGVLGPAVAAQRTGSGVAAGREAMWPAPTAEDWARPCLVTWQRSYEDARVVSEETGKAILVCVNMDGEIASEHYAGIRYRQPEIAALYEPYVTVIASVYRHNPRDYDEQGQRILCPRFGSVTCGEHISIEPGLFEQYFEGQRVAPRHIGVELDGEEMYDVFYAFDTDTIFNALRDGIANREAPPPLVRSDRTFEDRVTSKDGVDRSAVEQAYLDGDREQRRALLAAALDAGEEAPVDLLRLAIFGFDVELSRMARRALVRSSSGSAVDLIAEALRVAMDETERNELIAALERLGASFPRAATLAVVQRGLNSDSSAVDIARWTTALDTTAVTRTDRTVIDARIESQDQVFRTGNATEHLELAEALLTFAYEQFTVDEEFARLLLMDAQRAAQQAEKQGAFGWRVNSALAVSSYYLDDVPLAHARAEAAVMGGMPTDSQDWNTMAVLAIFAQQRQEAIRTAFRDKTFWPASWLTDVHAACAVLMRHPHGTDEQVVAYHDFLRGLTADDQADRVLEQGLARFPASWDLHARKRREILMAHGLKGLEPAYEAMLAEPDALPELHAFAGYASLVSAEFRRRAGRDEHALAAYDRAIAHYERAIEADPDARADADHHVALSLAGRARIAFEGGDHERALDELIASFERRPEAAGTLDGLNIAPADTARMLMARVEEVKRADLVARLAAALDKLDPQLLRLPAYEGQGPSEAVNRRWWQRRRGP